MTVHTLQDVALVSLGNVLYRLGYETDATAVMHISLQVSHPIWTVKLHQHVLYSADNVNNHSVPS